MTHSLAVVNEETTRKWGALVSYELAPKVLKDLLPVDARLNAQTVRNQTVVVAERCEDEPDAPFNIGIDGGSICGCIEALNVRHSFSQ